MMGKKMSDAQVLNNSIDVSGLAVGIYLVKLNFENGSISKRIIIRR